MITEMAIQVCSNCGAKNRVDDSAANNLQPVCGRCGEKLSVGATGADTNKPQVVTDASFANDVVNASASQTVLVDCWAAWCGPCRMIAPVLDELASESRGSYFRTARLRQYHCSALMHSAKIENVEVPRQSMRKLLFG